MAGMDLSEVAERLAARRPASGTYIIGVTGAVAAGKSVFAADLAEHLAGAGERVEGGGGGGTSSDRLSDVEFGTAITTHK